MTPQRPSFLGQEEVNPGGGQSTRDPQFEFFRNRFVHDQEGKEEIRATLRLVVEENRKLKGRLEEQELLRRVHEEPRFSTPEEDGDAKRMKEVAGAP